MDFQDKVVLITGAAGDIGGAVARGFVAQGARLALVDLNPDHALADEFAHALAIGCDVGDPSAVDGAVAQTLDAFGQWDILINVAGMMTFKPITDHTAEDWRRLLAVNLVAPALFTGHALRHMPRGGAIVNIASVHARRTSAAVSSYAASKAGLVSLTRSTAIEGKAQGIRCNAILPGAIDTAMLRESPNIKSGEEVVDPADIGQPEDIAALALFLASEKAGFVTGEDLVADGGRMGRL